MTVKYCEVHANIRPYKLVPASVVRESDPVFRLCMECYQKYLSKYEDLLGIAEIIEV